MKSMNPESITPVQQGQPTITPTIQPETKTAVEPPKENQPIQIQLGNTEVLKIKLLERIIQQNDEIIRLLKR